jgi:glutaredoxin
MKSTFYLLLFILVCSGSIFAQENTVEIEEQLTNNRLSLYAVNENLQELDVMITISGTNFRQSKSKPRLIRVPATSKVLLKTIMVDRGKTANYTYDLIVKDSLSRRALKKQFENIKINPKKSIVVYSPANCVLCDSLVSTLNKSPYRYKYFSLSENPDINKQLKMAFTNTKVTYDSIQNPIISLNGVLHSEIKDFDQLLEEINKEEK